MALDEVLEKLTVRPFWLLLKTAVGSPLPRVKVKVLLVVPQIFVLVRVTK